MSSAPQITTSAPVEIFERAQIRRTRNRAAARLDQHDFLFGWAQEQLAARLADIKRQFPLCLQIGARAAPLAPPGARHYIGMDLAEKLLAGKGPAVQAEEEFLPFADQSFDLVTSALSLHSVNDLPGALVQIRRVLKPDGVFLAALCGGETLHELRAAMMQAELAVKNGASPRVFPFADAPQMAALMQRAGFALPVVDSEIIQVTYDHPFRLMHDLRGMGEGNAIADRSRHNPGKAFLAETARLYQEAHEGEDGRISATFEIIFLIGWAPHPDQQQPQRPGSAQHSLAEALGSEEHETGDKAKP